MKDIQDIAEQNCDVEAAWQMIKNILPLQQQNGIMEAKRKPVKTADLIG